MDRNVVTAFREGASVIIFYILLAIISIMFVFAYKMLNARIESEGINNALIESKTEYAQEDEDITLYTGRTTYHSSYGDDVSESYSLYGDTTVTASKENYESGELCTGASVFAELMSLPDSVRYVTIQGHRLYNDPSSVSSKTVSDHPNIAYYVHKGLTSDLLTEASIGLTDTYAKSYEYDSKYGYITAIIYTKL